MAARRRAGAATVALGLAALAALAAGCGSGDPSSPGGTAASTARTAGATASTSPRSTAATATAVAPPPDGVAIHEFQFTPNELVVAPGATVTFRNDDDFEHRVQRLDTNEASPDLGPGATWTFVATGTPGTEIPYYCAIHNAMRARVRISA